LTLGEKQRRFTECIGRLIQWAYENGFELTFGDAYRSPEQAAANAAAGTGIANSVHTVRLAVDFNLFIDGVFQQTTDAHRPLGEHWKSLDPDARWGGDFKKSDGNHYSFTHEGRS
jgi:hypothetical protein